MAGGRLYKYLGLLAIAVFATIAQGCGSDSSTSSSGATTTQPDLPPAVTEAEIQRYKPGTAEHTALTWWRTVQVNDPELARTLYAEPPTLPDLAGQFNFVAGQLAGIVKIAAVKGKGKQAVVAINWDKPGASPRQVSLLMERKHGEWKIVSTRFLDLIVQQMQRSGAAPATSG